MPFPTFSDKCRLHFDHGKQGNEMARVHLMQHPVYFRRADLRLIVFSLWRWNQESKLPFRGRCVPQR